MDALETIFRDELIEAIGSIKYNAFKKGFTSKVNSPIYDAALRSLRSINNTQNINNGSLTLLKDSITKLKLPINKYRVFIYCGCYMLRGQKVVLLELSETIGTYFLEDNNIVRQLQNFKIGLKIALERKDNSLKGINLILPHEENNIGLFEKI